MEGSDLFVLAFFVAWIVGSILKLRGPGRAPAPRRREAAPPPLERPRASAERPASEELVPADLWEMLTGERLPAPVARGPHGEDDEEGSSLETLEARPRPEAEARSLERIVEREVPRVVSLEGEPPPPAVRHAAFHARIDPLPAAAPRRSAGRGIALGGPGALRRSIVLTEVLGPPKALRE